MAMIEKQGAGVLVALHAASPGSLSRNADLRSGKPSQGGEALRDYGIGAQILRDLRITRVRLLTNNPQKITGLEGYGIKVVERRPIEVPPHKGNIQYLRVKKEKLGHLFSDLKPLL